MVNPSSVCAEGQAFQADLQPQAEDITERLILSLRHVAKAPLAPTVDALRALAVPKLVVIGRDNTAADMAWGHRVAELTGADLLMAPLSLEPLHEYPRAMAAAAAHPFLSAEAFPTGYVLPAE